MLSPSPGSTDLVAPEPHEERGFLMKICGKGLKECFSSSQSKRRPHRGNPCLVGGETEARRVEMSCLEKGQVALNVTCPKVQQTGMQSLGLV